MLLRLVDTGPDRTSLTLGTLRARLAEHAVTKATLLDADHKIQGTLRNGTEFEVSFPGGYTARITQQIVDAKVGDFNVDSQQGNPILSRTTT